MKKRNNPKIDAMRERSLMVESERQDYERNYTINEQLGINVDDEQTTIRVPVGGEDIKNISEKAPIAFAVAIVAAGAGKIIGALKDNQKDKINDLLKRIELVVEKEITAEERDCLERKNKPINLINLKSLWNKEKQFNVWLSKCITDNAKLSKIISDTETIMMTYKQDKINKREERREKKDSRIENR